jgi:hypothetical protein
MIEDGAITFDIVRVRMKELGITQRQVAEHLGIPQSALSNLLKGKRQAKATEWGKILQLLNMQPESVLPIPLVPAAFGDQWQDTSKHDEAGSLVLPPSLGTQNSFAVLVHDAGTRVYVLVDPERTDLFDGHMYFVKIADNDPSFYHYLDGPARFQEIAIGSPDPISLGSSPTKVIGSVTGVLRRYDDRDNGITT